jgi:peptidoglycan/xylan/chitin deacetylase (PgdA/CDA1 family)
MKRIFCLLAGLALLVLCLGGPAAATTDQVKVPIILYHRFGPTVADSMTTTTKVFAAQMKWLKDNGYTVIPLRTLVNYLRGEGPAPAPKSVVIVADDGHKSVYSDMLPIVRQYKMPVTLFLYPSLISNKHVHYGMTWEQLKELQQTGLFDMQGHTFWHPNFKKDKKKMKPEAYKKDVEMQLVKSKKVLEKHLGTKVDLLAWPFGIYDDYLMQQAKKAGYVAAFSIERHLASKSDNLMAVPRYLMQNGAGVKGLAAIVEGHVQEKVKAKH